MGITIVADQPPAASPYDQWKVYRATTETGTYSLITTQAITDLTYYDQNGASTSWYKISYYDESESAESGLSSAIKGLSTTYTTVRKIESFLQKYTTSDSTNPDIQEMTDIINRKEDEIDYATGHAWRVRYSGTQSGQDTTAKYETYDFYGVHEKHTGTPIYLKHRKIYELDADEGDALGFWNGEEWENWITLRTEGRANDFWFDYTRGIMYVKGYIWSQKPQAFRIKYRYGETFLNRDIEDIATKLVAIDMLTGMDPRSMIVQEGSPVMSHAQRVDIWTKEIDTKLNRYKEWQVPSIDF